MRAEHHLAWTAADVGGSPLRRHVPLRLGGGQVFAVISGLGPPRAWALATAPIARSLEESLDGGAATGLERIHEPRLARAWADARRALVGAAEELIEREPPDACLALLLLEGTSAHAWSVGDGRIYLHREGAPLRLTPRDARPAGLLRGEAARSTTPLDARDLLLLGSASAFTAASIAELSGRLQSDPSAPVGVLAELLAGAPGAASDGAAAIVLRIR